MYRQQQLESSNQLANNIDTNLNDLKQQQQHQPENHRQPDSTQSPKNSQNSESNETNLNGKNSLNNKKPSQPQQIEETLDELINKKKSIQSQPNSNKNSINSNNSYINNPKPIKLEPIDKLPQISKNSNNNNFNNQNSIRNSQTRNETQSSYDSNGAKKIYRWHLWWDKNPSELRIPTYQLPNKNVSAKVGSFEFIKHKPGGGQVFILNEKPQWQRSSRIDHLAKDYKPGGGNRKILDERLEWNVTPKIGSFENFNHRPGGGQVSILNQPFDKKNTKPRIDTGFIYETVFVPTDYEVKSSPRSTYRESITDHRHDK